MSAFVGSLPWFRRRRTAKAQQETKQNAEARPEVSAPSGWTSTPDEPLREALRAAHQVRPLTKEEEGTGIDRLPAGVFGFTHALGVDDAPLFARHLSLSFEVHRLEGRALLVAFAGRDDAERIRISRETFHATVYPAMHDGAPELVTIDWARLHLVRRSAVPRERGGIEVEILPEAD
ncbi:MAG TPA: hypothetical protein VNK92_03055 [Vicinamibacterales bacterium]|nr:hypothetical protein [Vicinamibacterales bacterium]